MEEYRPSKQFLIIGGIALGVVLVILAIQTNWFHNLFHIKKSPLPPNTTLAGITTKDSNGNGIPDWEEELWGLDPTALYTNGKPNAEIIKEKRVALGTNNGTPGSTTINNETDAIAQQLFSITTALSQNQNIDDGTLQNIANQLGSSVNVKAVGNQYVLKNLHLVATSPASLTAYQKGLSKILSGYNLGQQDIQIIINATQTGDYSKLPTLGPIGDSYTALAKQLSALPVPIGVAQYHLDIVNSYAGMATSFQYLMQMQDNGTQALVGIALYKIYVVRGDSAFYDLNSYLKKYGILSS